MPVISTNLAANSAVRYLNINSASQTSSLSKLASGSRITQASDDAAGLAISTKISSDVTALSQAATNASHGISVLQTADGGASNISDILQRMKALASQSASGTVTDNERKYIDAEFQQLTKEIDAIAVGTRYNGQSLLDGSSDFAGGLSVMVGSSAEDTITIKLDTLSTTALLNPEKVTAAGTLDDPATVTPDESAEAVITFSAITTALTEDLTFSVDGVSVTLGKAGGAAADGTYTVDEVLAAVIAAVGTADYTAGATGTGTLTSTDATGATAIVLSSGQTGTLAALGQTLDAADPLSTASQDGAKKAILALDAAISSVSSARANIGSLESRFGFHQASIATSIENLTAAVSAIKDTDVASEAAKLASSKVKTQAAVAAAAQASQMPQDLLKLLQ